MYFISQAHIRKQQQHLEKQQEQLAKQQRMLEQSRQLLEVRLEDKFCVFITSCVSRRDNTMGSVCVCVCVRARARKL